MTWFFQQLIVSGLIMGALSLLYLLLLPLLQRRYRAGTLYLISLVLALGFLLPIRPPTANPVVTVSLPAELSRPMEAAQLPFLPLAQPQEVFQEQPPALNASAQPAESNAPASQALTLWDFLAAAWLAGALGILCFQGLRHHRFTRALRRWQHPAQDKALLHDFDTLQNALCPSAKVRLTICPAIRTPMLVGLFRPVILLPGEDFAGEELALVLTHELTHLGRRDLWVKAGLMIMTALNWFNPAAWLLQRAAVFAQETSCDERTLGRTSAPDRLFYSETILRVAQHQARTQTPLTTAFYGGKKGMKRRLTLILAGGSRIGSLLCALALALTLLTGAALGMGDPPSAIKAASPFAPGEAVYFLDPAAAGSRLITVPTANDWAVPSAAYMNGTPATLHSLTEGGSLLPAWGLAQGELNWAEISIGGDGVNAGLRGFVPVCFLSAQKPSEALPTVSLTASDPSGYVEIYRSYSPDSGLVSLRQSGEEALFLGQRSQWAHLQFSDGTGFAPLSNVVFSGETQAILENFMPDRFDNISYAEYQAMLVQTVLFEEKAAQYGTDNMELWPSDGKAWYSLMGDHFGGGFDDRRYLLPETGDLPEADAADIAWDAFVTATQVDPSTRDQYDFNMGFYTLYLDPPEKKQWQVKITAKDGQSYAFEVILQSPGGEVSYDGVDSKLLSSQEDPDAERKLNALIELEARKGSFEFWRIEDKAAFSKEYDYGFYGLPDTQSISQEAAVKIAMEHLASQYRVPPEDFAAWQMAVAYWTHTDMLPDAPSWVITFHDDAGSFLCGASLNAHTGEMYDSSDPYQEGNG